jgi:small subunit ribosomal protein S5
MPKQKSSPYGRQQKSKEYQKPDQEFGQKLLNLSRVARVTKGGRRFSFRATVVIGDKKGRVGVGVKRGKDVQFAVEKAIRVAKKMLINAPMTKEGTIPHETYGKSGSSIIFLKPAPEGRGIIAGGAVRTVCDLAGYKSIIGKIISRSGNKLNTARATIEALKKIKVKTKNNADPSTKKTKSEK